MAVEKVSVNVPQLNNMNLSAENKKPETAPVTAPKKDYRKVLAWSLGGLAVLGTAGVLIYNARKGRVSNKHTSELGTYAKKFADDSIFDKTAQRIKNGAQDVAMQVNPDRTILEMVNYTESFGCSLKHYQSNAEGVISDFDFSSRPLRLTVVNKNDNHTYMNYIVQGPYGNPIGNFCVKVDGFSGRIVEEAAEGAEEFKTLLAPHMQKFVDDLDVKRLIDEADYRQEYISNVFTKVVNAQNDANLSPLASKLGKSLEEVKKAQESPEFRGVLDTQHIVGLYAGRFGLSSDIYDGLKDKGAFDLLESFIKGEFKFSITPNHVVAGVDKIPEKTCYNIKLGSEHVPDELIRFSEDGEYFSFGKGCGSDYMRITMYNPKAGSSVEHPAVADIITPDATLYLEETGSRNKLKITHPNSGKPIEFEFNTSGQWDEGIEFADELKPHMSYMEKLAKIFSVDDDCAQFLADFPTKGKEMLEALMK